MNLDFDQYEEMREVWRADLLYQMDRTAERLAFRVPGVDRWKDDGGATDADLPELFKALDTQLHRVLATRFGVTSIRDADGSELIAIAPPKVRPKVRP